VGALVVSTAIPLPFPTSAFLAIAGVLNYPLRTFIFVVASGRVVRYGAIAAIASHYGRRFVAGLHLEGHSGSLLSIAAAVIVAMTAVIVLTKRLRSGRPAVKTHATGHPRCSNLDIKWILIGAVVFRKGCSGSRAGRGERGLPAFCSEIQRERRVGRCAGNCEGNHCNGLLFQERPDRLQYQRFESRRGVG